MMITSTPTTTTVMLCFHLLVLVVVVATATTTSTSKRVHPPQPRKPVKLKLHHRIHLDNSSYESYVQARLRGHREEWVASERRRRRRRGTKQHQHQQKKKNNHSSYGQELVATLPFGNPFDNGEYLIKAGIGNPEEVYYFQIDTGSLLPWLQCEPCINCYQQGDPIYDPGESTESGLVLEGDEACLALGELRVPDEGSLGQCKYLTEYEEGVYTFGYLITDRMSFPPGGGAGAVEVIVPIGCSTDTNPGLAGVQAGILGFGRGPPSLVNSLNLQSFSYCLVDPMDLGGESTLVLDDEAPAQVSYALNLPTLEPEGDKLLYVDLVAIAVNGEPVQGIPQGAFQLQPNNFQSGVYLDSGLEITTFVRAAYVPLREAFVQHTQAPAVLPPNPPYDLCFNVYGIERHPQSTFPFPTLTYTYDQGTEVTLDLRNYIDTLGGDIECLGIAPHDEDYSVIGINQQYGNRFYFDLINNFVTVTNDDC